VAPTAISIRAIGDTFLDSIRSANIRRAYAIAVRNPVSSPASTASESPVRTGARVLRLAAAGADPSAGGGSMLAAHPALQPHK
jgi:hypothetical protein